jgi:hypothetical protein
MRGLIGRKSAMIEFRMIIVVMIMTLEFEELPAEYKSMKASETIFRQPQQPFAKIRMLEQ